MTEDKPLAPGLYLVATPIGNLEDITLRALRILRLADRIACEDTRQTQKLLHHFALSTPTVSYHAFNESERAAELIRDLQAGARIAVVSDAGTPGIADPGAQIARLAIAAGIPVFPVPGANAAVSALIASGLPADTFTFHGFLPAKPGARRSFFDSLLRPAEGEPRPTHIVYETPHRILEALTDLAQVFTPAQPVVIARELTKLHEEFLRGPVAAVHATLAVRPQVRGEIVLLFAPLAPALNPDAPVPIGEAIQSLIAAERCSEMDAIKRIARERGLGKSDAYREYQRFQSRQPKPRR